MANAYYMINIAQAELQKFVRENRSCIGKPKKRMVRKYCPQPHGSCMQDRFMTETTQTGVTVDDLNLFANDDIPEYGEEGEHRGHSRLAIYDEERHMVNLETVGKIPNPRATFICVRDDYNFMATVDKFLEPNEYQVDQTKASHSVSLR